MDVEAALQRWIGSGTSVWLGDVGNLLISEDASAKLEELARAHSPRFIGVLSTGGEQPLRSQGACMRKKKAAENRDHVTLNAELRPLSEWTDNQIQEIVDMAVRFAETQDKLITDLEAAITTGDRERVWVAANRLCARHGDGKAEEPLAARKRRKEPPKIIVKTHYPPNCPEAADGWLQALRILMSEHPCVAGTPRVKGRPVFTVEATPYQNVDGFDVCHARLIANYGKVQRVVGVLELTREEWRELSSREVAS